MAIFGLKTRKSYSSDATSLNKSNTNSSTHNNNLEASDVIGDSPDFGQLANNRRGPSHASESSSLLTRNPSSMKKFFGSTRRKGSQSIDGGSPAQTNNNLQASDYFHGAGAKRASRTSLNKPSGTPTSPPVITPSAISPSLSTPVGSGSLFADAVGQNVSGGLSPPSASITPSGGPRPSELFAGRGVQWNQIDLTSREVTKPTHAATTTLDMQKFLKERRQWIPTFKDSKTVEEASVDLPAELNQFTFDTPAEITKSSSGLKSLKDLEDSHKRKAALLNPAPLASATNGTIFEEAGPSTSTLANGSEDAAVAKSGQTLPPVPKPPSRNQSFRTSTFAASNDAPSQRSGSLSRKFVPSEAATNGSSGAPSAAASRDIPQRRSSVRKELSQLTGASAASSTDETGVGAVQIADAAQPPRPANGRVEQIKEQGGTSEVTPAGTLPVTGSVRPSMETAGFATPAGSQSHEGEHAIASSQLTEELPSTPTAPFAEATQDSSSTVAPPSPARPPKNELRTPSRQNSKEAINNGISKVEEPAKAQVEKAAQAAPSLQNVVPGTGAATIREG